MKLSQLEDQIQVIRKGTANVAREYADDYGVATLTVLLLVELVLLG